MLLLLANAHAATPPPPKSSLRLWAEVAGIGGIGAEAESSLGGGLVGGLGVALGAHPRKAVGLQLSGREMVMSNDQRVVAALGADLRFPAGQGFYTGLGYAHAHESVWEGMDTAAAVFGTAGGVHRNGFELVAGYDGAAGGDDDVEAVGSRFRFNTQLTGMILPDAAGPQVYVFVQVGLRVGLLKPTVD